MDAVRPVADPARPRPVSSTTSKEDIMTRSLFSASSIAPVSRRRAGRLAVLAAATTLALAGCAPAAAAPETPAASSAATASAEDVSVVDAWVKAADEGMSAAFGEIRNAGTADATLASVTTPASSMVELHETTADASGQMVMREKEGGFTIPAGGTHLLEPGGDHIMLMELSAPLRPGEEVELELTFDDGSSLTVSAPVKDYAGANENYEGGEHGGHGGNSAR